MAIRQHWTKGLELRCTLAALNDKYNHRLSGRG